MSGAPSRMVRVNELLKREIADTIEKFYPGNEFIISITEVDTSPDLREAKVFFSTIRPDKEQHDKAFHFLKKHRAEIQKKISSHVILKYTPILSFQLDNRIETGDRILSLIEQLEKDEDI